jgi:DNA-binding MarR family transcriptional regulator
MVWTEYFNHVENIKKAFLEKCPFEGFSATEFFTLKLIMECEKNSESSTTKSIGEHFDISRPAVSQMLNSLERKGLIERSIDKDDRRQICVIATGRGKELVIAQCKRQAAVLDSIKSKVDENDINELKRIMNKIFDAVKEA